MMVVRVVKKLLLAMLVFSLFVSSPMDAAGKRQGNSLTSAYWAQVSALILHASFFTAAYLFRGGKSADFAAKSKIAASCFALLNELLDLYNNGKTDPCYYTYSWAAYDLYEIVDGVYSLMNKQEVQADVAVLNDSGVNVKKELPLWIDKLVSTMLSVEICVGLLVADTVSSNEISTERDVARIEVMRSLQSLARCGAEFFAANKASKKQILLLLAALANIYGLSFVKFNDNAGSGPGKSRGPFDPRDVERAKHLQTLGLSKGATDTEITRAYRKLAKQFHPDKNPGDLEAERRFKEISEANTALTKDKTVEQKI